MSLRTQHKMLAEDVTHLHKEFGHLQKQLARLIEINTGMVQDIGALNSAVNALRNIDPQSEKTTNSYVGDCPVCENKLYRGQTTPRIYYRKGQSYCEGCIDSQPVGGNDDTDPQPEEEAPS